MCIISQINIHDAISNMTTNYSQLTRSLCQPSSPLLYFSLTLCGGGGSRVAGGADSPLSPQCRAEIDKVTLRVWNPAKTAGRQAHPRCLSLRFLSLWTIFNVSMCPPLLISLLPQLPASLITPPPPFPSPSTALCQVSLKSKLLLFKWVKRHCFCLDV